MKRARRSATRIAITSLALAASTVNAQGLSSGSGASLAITAPTEAQYDAGASGASGNYSITTTCTGSTNAGCRLFIQYGTNSQGQQVGLQFAIVSRTSNCSGAVANPNAWFAVAPATVILSTAKNQTCTAAFRFRVNPLTYALYTSPAPNGAYKQRAVFLFTRP